MTITKPKPKQQEKLSDTATSKDSEWLFFYNHVPWVAVTLSGLLGFLSIDMKNTNAMTYLPIFVYFNIIHIAKSCLSYNKTMILTMMCLFPTSVAVICVDPQFNGDIMRILMHLMFMGYLCFAFCRSGFDVCLTELRNRLLADKKLQELIHHETMFTKNYTVCLGTANAAAFLGLFCYFGAVWPLDKVPLEPRETFLKIYVSLILVGLVLVTLYFAARTFKSILKIRSLKAATKVVKEAKVLV